MTPPKARCFHCNDIIWSHDPRKTTQRPKYCSEACKKAWMKSPTCGRCLRPLGRNKKGKLDVGRRYHEHCAYGCKYCGKDLWLQPSERKHQLPNTYCSEECRNKAWEGQPMPTCLICGETVTWRENASVWRDPPGMHHGCRPDSVRNKGQVVVDEMTMQREAAEAFRPYQPFEHPPFQPDGILDASVDVAMRVTWEPWICGWTSEREILEVTERYGPELCPVLPRVEVATWSPTYHLDAQYLGPFDPAIAALVETRLEEEARAAVQKAELDALVAKEEAEDVDEEYIPEDWE